MAIELRALSSASPVQPFSFNDLDEEVDTSSESSPEIPIAERPSPPLSLLPLSDANVYGIEYSGSGGLGPLYPEAPLVQCEHCDKPILASALMGHQTNCEKIRAGGAKEKKEDEGSQGQGGEEPSKKRKADSNTALEGTTEPQPKKKKISKTTKPPGLPGGKGSRTKGPLDLDKQCGVFIEKKGAVCTRSITCKVHSMRDKRMVQGRSKQYDDLVIEFRKLLDPTFVEPPKRETKAERKEKKEKERREKRERDIEAGLIPPDAPLDGEGKDKTKKKKKGSSKKKAANAASGSGVGSGVAGTSATDAAGGGEDGGKSANGEDDEPEDLDSEAEADALIDAVQRARGIARPPPVLAATSPVTTTSTTAPSLVNSGGMPRQLGVPLALPTGASSFFVARNEALRCCADIVRSALGSGHAATSVSSTNGPSGAAPGSAPSGNSLISSAGGSGTPMGGGPLGSLNAW